MTEHLFVYGTLAPGQSNQHFLGEIKGTWMRATVNGILYREGWGAAIGYPGIVLNEMSEKVHGLMFNSNELERQFERLDEFEGEGYKRVITTAKLENGPQVLTYIYALIEGPKPRQDGLITGINSVVKLKSF